MQSWVFQNLNYDGLYLNNFIINNISTSVSCQPQAILRYRVYYIYFVDSSLTQYIRSSSTLFVFLPTNVRLSIAITGRLINSPSHNRRQGEWDWERTNRERFRQGFALISFGIVSHKELIECPISLLKLIFLLFQSFSKSPTQLWIARIIHQVINLR